MIKLVSEPAIATKIMKMQQRVRWQAREIIERQIDQTCFILDDGRNGDREFSFLVIGDSGTGYQKKHHPQRQVAELMLPHHPQSRFMLHTGDVVYLVGSSEYYPHNFIAPYREFLVGGENHRQIPYNQMTFKLPIFPVPGNHDYYDIPLIFNLLSIITLPIRRLFRSTIDFDAAWHGSYQGDAYAQAFLDYLKKWRFSGELAEHLDQYYTAKTNTGRCLNYQPGYFTRLPNRYYTFNYGGIDFFALDSNTFNQPQPLPNNPDGDKQRINLKQQRDSLIQRKREIIQTLTKLNSEKMEEAEQIDDLEAHLSQIEEIIVDIDKQLGTVEISNDTEQLNWFKERLIASWRNPEVRGRIVFFHHPPYVTEATKWQQSQTLAVRKHFAQTLDAVAQELGDIPQGRALIDLVFNGHAHCLEYIQTLDTGHADSHINWLICGGSGFSLRRQREEGGDLIDNDGRHLAHSLLFLGRSGSGRQKRRPYSCLRIDVCDGSPPKFRVRPLVAERYQGEWHNYEIEPFLI